MMMTKNWVAILSKKMIGINHYMCPSENEFATQPNAMLMNSIRHTEYTSKLWIFYTKKNAKEILNYAKDINIPQFLFDL